jgi:hypothetical protein
MTAKNFVIPGDTKYVKIKANNAGHVGGILASFSNGVLTDESWECADMSSCNSKNCDSKPKWRQAVSYGLNNKTIWPWGTFFKKAVHGIERKARWIWVADRYAKSVWCMKSFSK